MNQEQKYRKYQGIQFLEERESNHVNLFLAFIASMLLILTVGLAFDYGLAKDQAIQECTSYNSGQRVFDKECFESKGY